MIDHRAPGARWSTGAQWSGGTPRPPAGVGPPGSWPDPAAPPRLSAPPALGGISIGRLLGIPVSFHWSWLLVLAFIAWSLAMGYFPFAVRRLGPSTYLALGAITAILFCLSILAHELAHAVVARRERIPVRGITLFAFGGVAQIEEQPRTPGAEFRVAIVGPLTSLALAWLFSQVAELGSSAPLLAIPSAWLARTNLALALFNLLPGFPLDGGRVFRAAAWRIFGDLRPATRIAAGMGRLVAYGFIAWGVLSMVFWGGPFNGLWVILLGTFLRRAAAVEAAQTDARPTPPAPPAPPAAPTPSPPYAGPGSTGGLRPLGQYP
jgi:Zn-dependent protease